LTTPFFFFLFLLLLRESGSQIKTAVLSNGTSVSCVLWEGTHYISGTDIVKALVYRFESSGRVIRNMKKFEEGVFSDLRNLKPGKAASLEEPRSGFLDFLHKNHCIRTQKKQKVFHWLAVPHDKLYLDSLEREVKRENEPESAEGVDADKGHQRKRSLITVESGESSTTSTSSTTSSRVSIKKNRSASSSAILGSSGSSSKLAKPRRSASSSQLHTAASFSRRRTSSSSSPEEEDNVDDDDEDDEEGEDDHPSDEDYTGFSAASTRTPSRAPSRPSSRPNSTPGTPAISNVYSAPYPTTSYFPMQDSSVAAAAGFHRGQQPQHPYHVESPGSSETYSSPNHHDVSDLRDYSAGPSYDFSFAIPSHSAAAASSVPGAGVDGKSGSYPLLSVDYMRDDFSAAGADPVGADSLIGVGAHTHSTHSLDHTRPVSRTLHPAHLHQPHLFKLQAQFPPTSSSSASPPPSSSVPLTPSSSSASSSPSPAMMGQGLTPGGPRPYSVPSSVLQAFPEPELSAQEFYPSQVNYFPVTSAPLDPEYGGSSQFYDPSGAAPFMYPGQPPMVSWTTSVPYDMATHRLQPFPTPMPTVYHPSSSLMNSRGLRQPQVSFGGQY